MPDEKKAEVRYCFESLHVRVLSVRLCESVCKL